MANIKKELRLVATLDDSAFRRQIEQLKKSLGKDFAFDAQGMNSLRDVFKDVAKDFSAEIRKALEGVKTGRGKEAIAEVAAETMREQRRSRRPEVFDPETGRYLKGRVGDIFDPQSKKFFKTESDLAAFRKAQQEKADKEIVEKERREKERAQREDLRRFSQLRKERDRLNNTEVGTLLQNLGIKGRTARNAAAAVEQGGSLGLAARGAAGGVNVAARGIGGALGVGAGTATLAAVGVIGAAIVAKEVGKFMQINRDVRRLDAQSQQEAAIATMGGRGLEGVIRRGARRDTLTGVTGGVSQTVDDIFSLSPSKWISALSGKSFQKGSLQATSDEAETRLKESEAAMIALNTAKALRDNRLQAMAGGGVSSSQLSLLQQRGAQQFGFNPEETIQQFNQARQSLGNRGARFGLPTLQELNRRVGLEVGEGARSAELFAGASGRGMASGVSQTVEILKKGVASGLDASKSSQFLKTTADFVQSNTGFAQLNVDQIGDALSRSAFSFARGGVVTQPNLQQARDLQETIRNASSSTTGLAGAANINSVLEFANKNNLKMDTFQALALARASNLGQGAMEQVLSEIDPQRAKDLASKLAREKQNIPMGIASMMFKGQELTASRAAFAFQEGGLAKNTEDAVGMFNALNFQGPPQAGNLPARPVDTEMQSKVAEATAAQKAFAEGLSLMKKDTEAVSEGMQELARRLKDAAEAARGFAAAGIDRSGNR